MVSVDITLNAPLRPLDRGDRFEDPLAEILEQKFRAVEATGGGTLLGAKREPESCDVTFEVKGNPDEVFAAVVAALERLGAPKGSTVRVGDDKRHVAKVGVTEGIGIYLNGTDLPDEVYQNADVNEFVAQLDAALGDAGQLYSYWEGPTETALYYYGPSASRMRELVAEVVGTHPLAQLSRITQLTP